LAAPNVFSSASIHLNSPSRCAYIVSHRERGKEGRRTQIRAAGHRRLTAATARRQEWERRPADWIIGQPPPRRHSSSPRRQEWRSSTRRLLRWWRSSTRVAALLDEQESPHPGETSLSQDDGEEARRAAPPTYYYHYHAPLDTYRRRGRATPSVTTTTRRPSTERMQEYVCHACTQLAYMCTCYMQGGRLYARDQMHLPRQMHVFINYYKFNPADQALHRTTRMLPKKSEAVRATPTMQVRP
jgi:hypothetical protein